MLDHQIAKFLNSSNLMEELPLTEALVKAKYDELALAGISGIEAYNSASAMYKTQIYGSKQPIFINSQQLCFLERRELKYLAEFYKEHGLRPLSDQEVEKQQAYIKIQSAFDLLNLTPECSSSIFRLTNCIQVISSEGPEYDTSYSHPDIPFTIFVSVCTDTNASSNIRVAESILHEAMHLKLTLIQQYIHLIEPGSKETFYSPWRETQRPLNGVIHGLFVFFSIRRFLFALQSKQGLEDEIYQTASQRIIDIDRDFKMLKLFPQCEGLTKSGKELAYRLLQEIK